MSTKLTFALFALLMMSQPAVLANDNNRPKYYVVVNGDNLHPVSGAATTPKVMEGVFISDDFSGRRLYLLMKQGNNLSQYQPKKIDKSTGNTATSLSATTKTTTPKTANKPFQLINSRLIKHVNGNARGWQCNRLTVLINGDITRIDCDKTMRLK